MRSVIYYWSLVGLLSAGCAPQTGGAPVAPIGRSWAVPTLRLYEEWWAKNERCAGVRGDMSRVAFYAVDSPTGSISLGTKTAHGWWVRKGNRIYLPSSAVTLEKKSTS